MDFFLKAKHWQIFLIVIGIPVLIEIIEGLTVLSSDNEANAFRTILKLLLMVPLIALYSWLYAVGSLMQNRINSLLDTKSSYFPFLIYTSAIAAFLSLILALFYWQQLLMASAFIYVGFGVVVFMSVATLFLAVSFVAKTLVMAERNAEVRSSDFYGEYVMILFFFIGIWLLQPRVNELYEQELSTH
ncbi:MAG: hypothetical protein ACFCUU_16840 [Cyclobacteriaceae bacterium]